MSGAERSENNPPSPEFSRMMNVSALPAGEIVLSPNAAERAALAARFGYGAVEALSAALTLSQEDGAVAVHGRLHAEVALPCAVSGEAFTASVDEPLALRFVRSARAPDAAAAPGEEIALEAADCDDIPFAGESFDLGEAVAQSLALAIDPYPIGPDAEHVRREYGLDAPPAHGPFAALAALKKEP